jgi:hypothetical protein
MIIEKIKNPRRVRDAITNQTAAFSGPANRLQITKTQSARNCSWIILMIIFSMIPTLSIG